jgi:hypothetical protein
MFNAIATKKDAHLININDLSSDDEDELVLLSPLHSNFKITSRLHKQLLQMNSKKKSTSSIFRRLLATFFDNEKFANNNTETLLSMPIVKACIGK